MSGSAVRAGQAYVEIGLRSKVKQHAKAIQRDVRAMGQGMLQAGGVVGGLGLTLAAPFAFATKAFADFDMAMSAVSAISGATGKDFEALRDKAKELGASTSFTATQAAEGMKYLGMAGYNTQQILSGIGPVLSLAAAGALELGTAADIASDVSSAFGFTADQIGHVADVIAVTATSANTSVEMMGRTFREAAPLARVAGQSIEELSAAAGILGNSGIKSNVAGTDLKNIMVAFADGKTRNAMKAMGVDATDSAGNIRPMLDVMQELGSAMGGMSEADRLAKIMEIFGRESGKSAAVLMDAGDSVEQLRSKLADADGAAARMAETMLNNLGGAGIKLMSALDGVKMAIGESLKGPLMQIASVMSSAMSSITEFIGRNQGLVVIAATVTAGLIGIGGALTSMGVLLMVASPAIGMIGAMISGLLSPIALAAAGIVGLGYYLATQTQLGATMIDVLAQSFGPLVQAASDAMKGITNALAAGDMTTAWELATDLMEFIWLDLTGGMQNAWGEMMNWLLDAGGTVAEKIGQIFQAVAGVMAGMLDGYRSYYDSIYNFTSEKLNALGGKLTGVETIGGPVKPKSAFDQQFGGMADGLKSRIQGISEFGGNMTAAAGAAKTDRNEEFERQRTEREQKLKSMQLKIAETTKQTEQKKEAGETANPVKSVTDFFEELKGKAGIQTDLNLAAGAQEKASTLLPSLSSGFAAGLLNGFGGAVTKEEKLLEKIAASNERIAKKENNPRWA